MADLRHHVSRAAQPLLCTVAMLRLPHGFALLLASALGCALGCGSSGEGLGGRPNSGIVGGSGAKRPECGALAQGCMGQGLDAPIALGGTLEIQIDYQLAGSSGPPTKLVSATPGILQSEGDGRVTAVGEGMSALLFVGPDEAVIDFLHVWVAKADDLRILRYASNGALLGRVSDDVKLLVGDELLVSVETFGKGQALLGNYVLDYQITGSNVAIVPDPVGGWYRIVARTAGAATVTFDALGLKKVWTLEVLP